MILLIVNCLIIGFIAYAIGRIGHIYGGHLDGPDHWIWGVLLFIPGLFIFNEWAFLMFAFGVGLIISDLKDFINLKFYGPDHVEKLRFWHID